MTSRDALKEEILKKAVVHGKVILSSGKEADYYVDLRRVTLDSTAAPLVGDVMLDLVKDWEFDAVGGLTLGADPVATAMMHVAAHKGKKIDSFVGGDMHHCCCNWVCTKSESAYCIKFPIFNKIKHDFSD